MKREKPVKDKEERQCEWESKRERERERGERAEKKKILVDLMCRI